MQLTAEDIFLSGWAGYGFLFPEVSLAARFLVPFSPWQEEEVLEFLMESKKGGTLLAWSSGAHMVLKGGDQVLEHFDRVILIAPFLDFTRCLPLRILKAMSARITGECQSALSDFYANCGLFPFPSPGALDEVIPEELIRGLDYLSHSFIAPDTLFSCGDRVHIVHGRQDKIVPNRAVRAVRNMLHGASFHQPDCGHFISEDEFFPLCL